MSPVCQGCGESIQPSRGGPPKKWCSERCRKSQYAGTCKVCGDSTNGYNGPGTAASRCLDCLRLEADLGRARVLSLWNRGMSEREIADRLGVTLNYIRGRLQVARRKGESVASHGLPDRTHWEEVERRWLAGQNSREIAAAIGIRPMDVGAVVQNMRKAGRPLPRRRKVAV